MSPILRNQASTVLFLNASRQGLYWVLFKWQSQTNRQTSTFHERTPLVLIQGCQIRGGPLSTHNAMKITHNPPLISNRLWHSPSLDDCLVLISYRCSYHYLSPTSQHVWCTISESEQKLAFRPHIPQISTLRYTLQSKFHDISTTLKYGR